MLPGCKVRRAAPREGDGRCASSNRCGNLRTEIGDQMSENEKIRFSQHQAKPIASDEGKFSDALGAFDPPPESKEGEQVYSSPNEAGYPRDEVQIDSTVASE